MNETMKPRTAPDAAATSFFARAADRHDTPAWPPGMSDLATPSAVDDEDAAAEETVDAIVRNLMGWRRAERDIELIKTDPTGLAGYGELPPDVQALAVSDPMRFWMLWQLTRAGVDLRAIEAAHHALRQGLDRALGAAGWDGTKPPTDEQFDAAEDLMKRSLRTHLSTLVQLDLEFAAAATGPSAGN